MNVEEMVSETYALHYVLMNLGFRADDIFVLAADVPNVEPPGRWLVGQLRTQGCELNYTVAPLPTEEVEKLFIEAWQKFAAAQPKMDRKVLDVWVHGSRVWRDKVQILKVLTLKGFDIPSVGAPNPFSFAAMDGFDPFAPPN